MRQSVFVITVLSLAVSTASAQQTSQPPAAQQAPTPGAQISAPSSKPPLPNRLNTVMPGWLRVRGEFRERVEGFDNSGFNDARDDLYYLSRFRFNVATTSKYVNTTIQLHDARVADKSIGPTTTPFRATFDLRQAFADFGTAKSRAVARLGRQDLSFGDQRLVGPLPWTNAARSFDGARVTFRAKATQVDVFGASLVRVLEDEFDKSGNGNRFAGVYVSSGSVLPAATVEPYVFYRRDINQRPEVGSPASLQQVTSGARLAGKLPAALDYNIEMDVQAGTLGTDDVSAWAGHWQLRRTFSGKMTPHVTGEYNYASGDENPADGTRGTFDQLYPTGHDKYGLADLVGWRNIRHVRAGFDMSPFRATPITVNYHSYWLAQKTDGLYAASGVLIARVPSGAASAHVGQEIDVQVARPLTPQLALAGGYSHLFTGAFLKEATPGKSYTGPFVMLTYVFLAER